MKRTTRTKEAYKRRLNEVGVSTTTLDHLPSIKEWEYWRIVENEYPYDAITNVHHILIPKEKMAKFIYLSEPAQKEFYKVLETIRGGDYDYIMENIHTYSVKSIVHYQLIKMKK